jgi:hypothetical protein
MFPPEIRYILSNRYSVNFINNIAEIFLKLALSTKFTV